MAKKTEKSSAESNEREVHIFISGKLYSQAKLLTGVTDCSFADILRDSLEESLEKKIARHRKEIQELISCCKEED